MRSGIIRLLPVLILAAILITSSLPADAIMLVSRADEVRIGRQVEAQIIQQSGGLSYDPQLTARVQTIGNQVASLSSRRDIRYTFRTLNSRVVNAYAAPGGPVLVTEALARNLTDDELAFVLAHEVGHIEAQHGREAINQALISQGLFGLLFGGSSEALQIGLSIMYTLYNRGYSRSQEYQADSYGLQFMTRAGYQSEGAVTALAKLGEGQLRGLNRYFSTHPAVPDRINRVAAMAGISEAEKQALIRQARQQQ